tara:strand:+ start:2488 stop:3738 length:1251 start_codon:yes stop_codon:yes gene_type:complete
MLKEKSLSFVNKIIIFSLFLVLFIDGLGISLTLPLFADLFLIPEKSILPFTSTDDVRNFMYGLSLMSFALGMFLASPVLGQLSDRFGRKKILVLSLLGTCAGYIMSGIGVYVLDPQLFILGRVIDGLSAGSIPIAQAAISDVSSKENKAGNMGLILFAVTSGYILGPLCSELLVNVLGYALTAPFYATALLSLFSLLFLLPMQETTRISDTHKIKWLSAFNIFTNLNNIKGALLVLGGFLFFQLSWTMYFQFLPHVLTHLGVPEITTRILASIGLGMALSFCLLTRFFQSRITAEAGSQISILLILLCFLTLCLIPFSALLYFCTCFLSALSYGLGYSFLLVMLSQKVPPENQGLVMGLAASISAFSSVVTSLSGMALVNYHSTLILYFSVNCMLCALSILFLSSYVGTNRVLKRG